MKHLHRLGGYKRLSINELGTGKWESRAHIAEMQTRCPKCSTTVRSTINGKEWKIINPGCLELTGTRWADKPEFCPTLSLVLEPDTVLPGVPNRDAIVAEINRDKVGQVPS